MKLKYQVYIILLKTIQYNSSIIMYSIYFLHHDVMRPIQWRHRLKPMVGFTQQLSSLSPPDIKINNKKKSPPCFKVSPSKIKVKHNSNAIKSCNIFFFTFPYLVFKNMVMNPKNFAMPSEFSTNVGADFADFLASSDSW